MVTSTGDARDAPTLEAVAALAKVSRATASRVLRGAPNVSERARVSVEAAARKLRYSPNPAARSLVTGRSDSIAFYVDEDQDRLFSDPFFLGLLRGAQGAIAEAGLQLVFSVAARPEDHDRFRHYATGRHVDGVLLVSLHGKDQLPEALENLGVPTVLSGRPMVGGERLYYVDVDNVGGARTATRHLLDNGCGTVATITGPQDMCAGQDRLLGYVQAHQQRGLQPRDGLVAHGEFTFSSGHDAMSRLLKAHPDIDGVFAASDLTALGAMRAIESSGRRIGEDVAVIGFDDIGDAARATPALTTVRQPVADIGQTMAEILIRRIEGRVAPRVTILPVELVRRETA